ncbi:MAG TPA: serine hydrolase domain-containing protein [Thermomicrobiales bacterium]|nr:serine hydrolase domain-containing protein [Thermomicrobiales bacterium]
MRGTGTHVAAAGFASRLIDRRKVLAGSAGTLLGTALIGPSRAWAHTATPESGESTEFDPALAKQLQQVIDDIVASSSGGIPGMVLHVAHAGHGSWSGASGIAQIDPEVPMEPEDRFGVGSIVKPFVASTVLQIVEDGDLSLDDTLPDVLPTDVTERFQNTSEITIKMLLGHRSGLPDWDSADVEAQVAQDPSKVWTETEFLDIAAAKEAMFPPGTDYTYSNTNYTLLGMIIEQATGRSWRDEVTDGVFTPLKLEASALPAPGDHTLGGPHAHGYVDVNGEMLDLTTTDPSMAGSAGGNSLISSAPDLVHFLDALLAGQLFEQDATLEAMLDFQPAEGEPGQVGYGLGLLQRELPGGIQTIDHLGGAVGYRAYVARLMGQDVTLALGFNSLADPGTVVLPVLEVFAAPLATPTG